MKKSHLLSGALMLALVSVFPAYASYFGTTIQEIELKTDPTFDAPTIAKLPEKTRLVIGIRVNGWLAVETDNGKDRKAGWVRMALVRLEPQSKGMFAGLFGPRGLSGDDLKKAAPAPEELQKLQRYAISRTDVEKFASSVKLEKQTAAYPEPAGGEPEQAGGEK